MRLNRESYSVLITGLGGQGVLLVSKIIAAAAGQSHAFVCRTESRGLSQRGGSVCSDVRFGPQPVAPVIGSGTADVILSLDALEATRVLHLLKPNGLLLTNIHFVAPLHLVAGWRVENREKEQHTALDRQLMSIIAARCEAYTLDLSNLANSAQCERGVNLALLGAAVRFLPFPEGHLRAALMSLAKPQHLEQSLRAFDAACKAVPTPLVDNGRALTA